MWNSQAIEWKKNTKNCGVGLESTLRLRDEI